MEEHIASIFRVEKAKEVDSEKYAALPKHRLTYTGLYGVISQKITVYKQALFLI
jgi:hypothetical protein